MLKRVVILVVLLYCLGFIRIGVTRAMSRCIPYARTNYKREDVSLIGSIKKLQIQWGNTKQRKPVMSRMVKQKLITKKRSREEYDKLDFSQLQNKKRKVEKNLKFNKSCHFARKDDIDHFERSDLSEEINPPALVLNKCDSHKDSQNRSEKNANKKKQGMVVRIKLALKKHKDVEPESACTDLHRSSQVTKSFKPQPVLSDSSPPCPSEIAKPSKAQAILNESASGCRSELTKPSDGKSVVLNESSLRTKVACSANQPETSGEPCFAGHVDEAPVFQECFGLAKPSESSQHESERQFFGDLMINWKRPLIQSIEANEGELDWLFAPKMPEDAKPSAQICKTGVFDSSTSLSYGSSLQPRATYLPEFDMYQLPYVIPF